MSASEVRIFVSSPGDTGPQRDVVRAIVQRLNVRLDGLARLNATFWEDGVYSAHETFQNQIPEPTDYDLVVAIFKHRLGSPLPRSFATAIPVGERTFLSGTAYEVLSAINARRSGKPLPDILIYRRPETEGPRLEGDARSKEEIFRQYQALQAFFDENLGNVDGEFTGSFKTYRQIDDLQRMLEHDLRRWLGDRRGIHERAQVWDLRTKGSPFPGLQSFGPDRGTIFFGRDELIQRARLALCGDNLSESKDAIVDRPRFLLLVGASGTGKSSLLRAGIVPRLIADSPILRIAEWRVVDLTASGALFASLADALLQPECLRDELATIDLADPAVLQRQLRGSLETAWRPLRTALDQIAEKHRSELGLEQRPKVELLLVLDQVERSFGEASPEERSAFFDLIERCVREKIFTVLGSLRSDAYDGLQEVPALIRLRARGITLDVLPLSRTELENMLLKTAATCEPRLQFATCADDGNRPVNLASRLVEDAAGGDALPLLQVTLEQLYRAQDLRQDHTLACADFHGLTSAVTEQADAVIAGLAASASEPTGQTSRGPWLNPIGRPAVSAHDALKPLVLHMIADVVRDPNGDWRPVIKPVQRESFEREWPAGTRLIDALIAARLLVAEQGATGAQIRPTHEALLRIWPQARDTVRLYADQIHQRSKLEARVREWQEAPVGARDDYLRLPPSEREAAGKLERDLGPILTPPMREFLRQSRAHAEAIERRSDWRMNVLALVTLATYYAAGFILQIGISYHFDDVAFMGLSWTAHMADLIGFLPSASLMLFLVGAPALQFSSKIILKSSLEYRSSVIVVASATVASNLIGLALILLSVPETGRLASGIFVSTLLGALILKSIDERMINAYNPFRSYLLTYLLAGLTQMAVGLLVMHL